MRLLSQRRIARTVLPSLALASVLALAPQATSAQTPAAPSAKLVEPAPPGRVYLDVVVEPKGGSGVGGSRVRGSAVGGLTQQDFTLLDNKVAQPITTFAAMSGSQAAGASQPPVEVILVLDVANAAHQTTAFARDQLTKFLLSSDGELALPTTLAILTEKGVEVQPGDVRDGKSLSAALNRYDIAIHSIPNGAGFYGAEERLQLSLNALSQLTARAAKRPGRKVMVWISPGWPLLSGPRVDLSSKQEEQLYQEIALVSTGLRKARVTVYSVDPLGSAESLARTQYYKQFLKGVSKPTQAQAGDLGLQVLAVQTGGLVLDANNDIAGLLKQAVDDTKSYYEIAFDPPPSDAPGTYHQLEVRVGKPGLVARTRQGYYSMP